MPSSNKSLVFSMTRVRSRDEKARTIGVQLTTCAAVQRVQAVRVQAFTRVQRTMCRFERCARLNAAFERLCVRLNRLLSAPLLARLYRSDLGTACVDPKYWRALRLMR